jgi:uncharacterized protein (TIGR02145 family)
LLPLDFSFYFRAIKASNMRKTRTILKLLYVIPLILLWACDEEENMEPSVRITTPADEAILMRGDSIPIKAIAEDEDGSITKLSIYIGGEEVGSSEESTFIYYWKTADYEPGEYVLGALAQDNDGAYDAANKDVLLGAEGGLNPDLEYDTLTDIDGNIYATIEIGAQVWMAENLKVTHYSDGTPIPEISDEAEWNAMAPEAQAYCWYDNQIESGDTYGALYTWAAAMNGGLSSDTTGVQGVCPDGWHLPTDKEWKTLEMQLGMSPEDADAFDWRGTVEGGKLKEIGFSKWEVPNEGATNSSGFTAVPGGFRSVKGLFYNSGESATFWTSTADDNTNTSWYRTLNYQMKHMYRHQNAIQLGLSVRCVKN